MFANAIAISKLARLAGDTNTALTFAANAAALRDSVQTNLWNDSLQHYIGPFQKQITSLSIIGNFIRGRELAGYVPWYFELPDNDPKYNASWEHLLSAKGICRPLRIADS